MRKWFKGLLQKKQDGIYLRTGRFYMAIKGRWVDIGAVGYTSAL